MIGAPAGDISGSRFEGNNYKKKDFRLFHKHCSFTDDTVMSLAVCEALLESGKDPAKLAQAAVVSMQRLGRLYPYAGYGGAFRRWIASENPEPYHSWGNGAAMRVSGCGYAADTIEEAKLLARIVTEVTHDHPESVKAAEAVASAVFMAKTGSSMDEIRIYITENYYPVDFTLDEIRDTYSFDVSCQGSVPQAFEAFFEGKDFEDTIRNAVSIGGDSDTIAAIAGSIAEAYFGVPADIRKQAESYLDETLLSILRRFEEKYPGKTVQEV